MRVCFLSWRDGRHPEAGGAEVFLEQIARGLVARGHQVTVVTAAAERPAAAPLTDGIERIRRGGRLSVFPRAWWHALRRRRHYDVVVEVVNGVAFGARWARPRASVAVLHHSHQSQWTRVYPGWRGRLGRLVETFAVRVVLRGVPWITVSDSSRRDLELWRVPSERITVIGNAVDHVPGGAATPVPGRLVCTARLVPHKQIEHAIDVVAALAHRYDQVHLEVVGEGYWLERLRRHAASRGVEDRVRFHGRLDDQDRDRLVASAQLCLLPSEREGWGLVIGEAARWGAPSVAYRSAGGVSEAIDDGVTGRLVDSLDELIATVDAVLDDPTKARAWGRAARERSAARSWSDAAAEFESALQRLEP